MTSLMPLVRSMSLPFSTLVPSSRTISGMFSFTVLAAATIPFAMISHYHTESREGEQVRLARARWRMAVWRGEG